MAHKGPSPPPDLALWQAAPAPPALSLLSEEIFTQPEKYCEDGEQNICECDDVECLAATEEITTIGERSLGCQGDLDYRSEPRADETNATTTMCLIADFSYPKA